MPEIRWAPVPAWHGDPDVLPPGTEHDTQLTIPEARRGDALALLDELFTAHGLPTGRLVIRDGLHLWDAPDGETWLTVDYLVPGTRQTPGTGWHVLVNREAGRAEPGEHGADNPALDRYAVQVGELPDWLEPELVEDGDPADA